MTDCTHVSVIGPYLQFIDQPPIRSLKIDEEMKMTMLKKTTLAGAAAIALVAASMAATTTPAQANGKVFGAAFVGGLFGTMIANHHNNTYHGTTYVTQPYQPHCYWTTQTYWQYGVQYSRQVQVCS